MNPTDPRANGPGGHPHESQESPRTPPVRPPSQRRAGERPIGALISDLIREMRDLVRKEVSLARTEVSEKVEQATSGVSSLGAGAIVAFAGVLFLLGSATFALDLWIEQPWLSCLIVGGVVTLIGVILLSVGRSHLKSENLTLQRTARSLGRDAELAQHEMHEMHEMGRAR